MSTEKIKPFMFQVEQMRNAQILYFQQIAKAKKTKLPGDFAAAATTLKLSKQLEKMVDDDIVSYRRETEPFFEGTK